MLKRISKIFLTSLFLFCILSFINPGRVNAAKFVSDSYTLNREEILHDDLYISGETVEINGIVDGDVYIAANTVSITGTISDDLYIAGETATISGNVYGSLTVFGSAVDLSGSVGRNCYLFGGTVNSTGSVTDDLVAVGGNVYTEGLIDEDLIALGGDVNIESTIAEDLVVFGSKLSVSEALVSGEIYKEEGKFATQNMTFVSNPNIPYIRVIYTSLISGISMFLVGIFLIYVMPVKTLDIVKKSTSSGEEFIKSFATGFVVLFIVSVPVLFLLSATVVGLPMAGILLALIIFLAIYARLWVEIGIGKMILDYYEKKKYPYYTALLVGRGASILIGLIPIIGTVYSLILTLAGTGAFFRMKYELISPKKKPNVRTKKSAKD